MTKQPGEFTRQEIFSQPEAWAATLHTLQQYRHETAGLLAGNHFDQILYTGAGSTYYLSLSAAALTQELTGLSARAFPASELWLHPRSSYGRGRTLLVAVSRSGETSETLHACQAFLSDSRGPLLTLSCNPDSPLARMGTVNLAFPAAQERSVAQTRAFSSMYLAAVALLIQWADRPDLSATLPQLPQACERLLHTHRSLASDLARHGDLDRFYFLGSGPRYGLACELSLKMKEMSLSHSQAFHFLEFRHGPKSMVTPSTLLVGLRSTANAQQEQAVLDEMQNLGAHVLSLAEAQATVEFNSGLDETVSNVLFLPILQLLALERALTKGLDPDQPRHLSAVVRL